MTVGSAARNHDESMVITDRKLDNTNADTLTRAVWIDLAKRMNVAIRCVYFTASAKLCEHNDTVRALATDSFNPEKRSLLPHSAFAGYAAKFKEPSEHEGFQDITRIDFQVRTRFGALCAVTVN